MDAYGKRNTTRSSRNARSNADTSQLNLTHRTKNNKLLQYWQQNAASLLPLAAYFPCFTMGREVPRPQKKSSSHRDPGLRIINGSVGLPESTRTPKRHLGWFGSFSTVETNRHTDHATSVKIGRILCFVHTATRPKNGKIKKTWDKDKARDEICRETVHFWPIIFFLLFYLLWSIDFVCIPG